MGLLEELLVDVAVRELLLVGYPRANWMCGGGKPDRRTASEGAECRSGRK